jgi:hypothetical protein
MSTTLFTLRRLISTEGGSYGSLWLVIKSPPASYKRVRWSVADAIQSHTTKRIVSHKVVTFKLLGIFFKKEIPPWYQLNQ